MFRLLKEALAAPSSPPSQPRSSTPAASSRGPEPPGKRVVVPESNNRTDDALEEVKQLAEGEDWKVKYIVVTIAEWIKGQRTKAIQNPEKLEMVNTIPLQIIPVLIRAFSYSHG